MIAPPSQTRQGEGTQIRQKQDKDIPERGAIFLIIIKISTLYSPFRIFLPVSFITFLIGLFYYLYTFCMWGRFTNMSALLFTTSIVIFMMGLVSEQICQMRFEGSEGEKNQIIKGHQYYE